MTAIDRPLLRALRTEITEALAAVGKKHGFTIYAGNASFTESRATFKIEVVSGVTEEGESPMVTKAAADWKALAKHYGCEPEWLGKTFGQYEVVGLMPKSRRFAILALKGNKLVKIPVETIRILSGAKPDTTHFSRELSRRIGM